ncbi:MAG: hypothetical protein ABI681_03825 [Gemmatimonadales bacterium]
MTRDEAVAQLHDRELLSRTGRLMIEFLPDGYRDDMVGDLLEEASAVIAPRDGMPAARRWLRAQLMTSVPRMFALHFRQKEDGMKHARWIAAAAIVVVGVLQAWDSGILAAPPLIGAMVVIAIGIGIAALFTENDAIRLGAAALVFVLLFAARIASPVRLPELTLVGLPVFLILVLGPRFLALAKQKNGPPGPGTAA